jgi:hypothetical protein
MWSPMLTSLGASSSAFCPSAFSAFSSDSPSFSSVPGFFDPVEKRGGRERVLFIGTQFSILYTSMYSPAEAATSRA